MAPPSRKSQSSPMLRGLVGLAAACAGVAWLLPGAFVPTGMPTSKDSSVKSAGSFGISREQTSNTASSGSFCKASLLAASVAIAATAGRRFASTSMSAVRTVRPDGLTFRSEREKGEQVLPLKRMQRMFSTRNRQFWDYIVYPRVYFKREWLKKDIGYLVFFLVIHAGALAAPFFFNWKAFASFLVGYFFTGCCGICLSYHRQLAHRSFKTNKFWEYVFAYCGACAIQSHPINWVSSHRHHHGATETERDVHSPLDGFWWAHMGWLMDVKGTYMRRDKNNASDLAAQPFYRFLHKYYVPACIVAPIAGLYALGGLPFVLWGFFFRTVWTWHVTWAVNSVSHCWGYKDWNTSCNSMNNWVIGILAFGEGWHNNHHAFEASCRHGLKWYQIDMVWMVIKSLEFVGIARDLKYPSEAKMARLSFPKDGSEAAPVKETFGV